MCPPTIQQQYLANWHDSFVSFVNQMLATIAAIEMQAQITDSDKQGYNALKLLLKGKDVQAVENDLANGVVSTITIDKIVGLNKQLADVCLEYVQMSPLVREFWKQLAHLKVESDKNAELSRLKALQISVL